MREGTLGDASRRCLRDTETKEFNLRSGFVASWATGRVRSRLGPFHS